MNWVSRYKSGLVLTFLPSRICHLGHAITWETQQMFLDEALTTRNVAGATVTPILLIIGIAYFGDDHVYPSIPLVLNATINDYITYNVILVTNHV